MNAVVDRRSVITAVPAVLPAAGAAVAAPATAAEIVIQDPLVDAVNRYRAGIAAYNAGLDADEDTVRELLEEPEDKLCAWDSPALTAEGAQAALELALEDMEPYVHHDLPGVLVRAALGYLKGRA